MPNQAEANLSALIESTEDLIWSVDLDYRLITFNRALRQHIETIFGVQPAVGMRPKDFVPPERAGLLPPFYERVLAEGSFRVEFPLADGRILELAFNPIIVDGETTGVSVFGKDITERKLSKTQLCESADALKEAQIIGGLGSYVLDLPTGVWTSSEVLDGIFGIDKEYDPTVAGWTALVHPEERALMAAYF